MKKKWAIGLIFMWMGSLLQAQYTTPGTGIAWDLDDLVNNSEGAVTLSDGEYFVNNDLVISPTDTLRLLENTVVKFQGGTLITVMGVLLANPPDSILFTASDTLMTYKSFRFEDSGASELINCRMEYGGGIDVVNSDLLFKNCVFRKNDKSNSTGVIDLFQSSPDIINCTFKLNHGPAILSGANSACSPYIYGNTIYRNNTQNTNMPQINLGTSASGIPIRIIANTIEGFYDKSGGIAVSTLAGGEIDCEIDSNSIYNNRYGITVYGYDISSVISNNTIVDNNIENLPMQGGSGINFWGGTSNASMVFGNEIHGNLWGITVTGNALPNFGQVENDTLNPGENSIYDNGNLGEVYALYNNTPNDLYAENNYWGSYDLDSVEMVIFHKPDDETLGFVDYLPLMDSLTTGLNDLHERKEVTVFPNPADTYLILRRPETFDPVHESVVTVFNATGQVTGKYKFVSAVLRIDISSFEKGPFFIEISDGQRSATSRFIKY